MVIQPPNGSDSGEFSIRTKSASIGRNSECQLQLFSKSVSRRHALLTFEGGIWYIQDLDSSNGTFLNGTKVVGKQPLKVRDCIRFADTEFVVTSDEAPDDNSSQGEESGASSWFAT